MFESQHSDVSTHVNTSLPVGYDELVAESIGRAESCCPAVTACVLDEDQATALAARLKALADPVRLRLVSLLACAESGEICACDLPALLGRKQPTISHHLKLLADAKLIEREQRGKWAWFKLADSGLDDIRDALGAPRPPAAEAR